MDPDVSFKQSLLAHLDRVQARIDAERQNQNWNVELFRQSALQSIQTTHLRDAVTELQNINREVEVFAHEIQVLVPVIVWIWDNVKKRPDLMSHLSAIEEKVRDHCRHHERHGHFFQKYAQHQNSGFLLFQTALQDLVSLFQQPDGWIQDPVLAMRRIHDAQDSVVMTGLFLELLHATVSEQKLVEAAEVDKIATALRHLSTLGQKLHVKEDRLRLVLQQ